MLALVLMAVAAPTNGQSQSAGEVTYRFEATDDATVDDTDNNHGTAPFLWLTFVDGSSAANAEARTAWVKFVVDGDAKSALESTDSRVYLDLEMYSNCGYGTTPGSCNHWDPSGGFFWVQQAPTDWTELTIHGENKPTSGFGVERQESFAGFPQMYRFDFTNQYITTSPADGDQIEVAFKIGLFNGGSEYDYARITSTEAGAANPPTLVIIADDMDSDGIPDHVDTDNDNDCYSDADEAAAGSDPRDPTSIPTPAGPMTFEPEMMEALRLIAESVPGVLDCS